MTDAAQKLRAARALIERGWTQKVYARGKCREVPYDSKSAVCYCAMGAIAAVNGMYPTSTLTGVDQLDAAIGAPREDEAEILIWNDAPERTKAEVLAAFDKAIQLAEQESA